MLGVSFPGRLGRRARVRASASTEGPGSYRGCVSQEGPQPQETPGAGHSASSLSCPRLGEEACCHNRACVCVSRREAPRRQFPVTHLFSQVLSPEG